MKVAPTLTFAAIALALVASPTQAQDVAAGKAAFTPCVACHGADGAGNKALNSPAIAGQEAWYVARQLQNFKAGARGTNPKDAFGMQMRPMAMLLADDAAIANVAAYVASLPSATVTDDGVGDAAAGKALYTTCAACHGAVAEGNQALNAPTLTILPDWYVVRQLDNFKAGIRGGDPKDAFGMQMRPMAMTLVDDAAVKNVAAYIASLR
jgi:cytochrome c oxidase subunit II